MNTNELTHVALDCPENIPDVLLDNLTADLKNSAIQFKVRKLPFSAYNSLEWALPCAIAAYILKPYFDSFLSEAGKDHYSLIKKWLKKVVQTDRQIKVHKIAAPQSKDKLDSTYSQSKSISIYCQTKDEKIIKMLFDETLSNEDWEQAIDKFIDTMIDNYKNFPNDQLSGKVSSQKKIIYAFIDKDTKELIFMDDNQMLQASISRR